MPAPQWMWGDPQAQEGTALPGRVKKPGQCELTGDQALSRPAGRQAGLRDVRGTHDPLRAWTRPGHGRVPRAPSLGPGYSFPGQCCLPPAPLGSSPSLSWKPSKHPQAAKCPFCDVLGLAKACLLGLWRVDAPPHPFWPPPLKMSCPAPRPAVSALTSIPQARCHNRGQCLGGGWATRQRAEGQCGPGGRALESEPGSASYLPVTLSMRASVSSWQRWVRIPVSGLS